MSSDEDQRMPDLSPPVGRALKVAREKLGLSQDALADLAGVSRSHYGRVERGEVSPTLETISALSQALARPLSQLIAQAEDMEDRSG